MSALRKLGSDDRGAAAVEVALIAPMFFALLFGALQGGLAFWTQLGLQQAVDRAARCAVVNATLCGASDRLQSYAATQALSAGIPAATFILTTESCGKAVTASTNRSLMGVTLNLSAKSCFPS